FISDLDRAAACHLTFGSEMGVRADMPAPVCVLDGEPSATARINPAARQYATIAILGLPIVMTSQKTGSFSSPGPVASRFRELASQMRNGRLVGSLDTFPGS